MPPTDENMPDFDSMTPEELMAWMETLAERQGAVEGFTTEKRVDIAEVDPDSAADTGPGYIPYGMSEEEWAKRSAKEDEERAQRIEERRKAREASQQPPAQQPAPAPAPEPEPAAPAASGGGEPDFDNMTPEELMAWMETLAERQGAVEGFTTEKRVDIAEVDPDSAADTGPGYIPYGMSEEEWAKRSAKEDEERAQRIEEWRKTREASQQPPAQQPAPAPPSPIEEMPELDDLEDSEEIEPAASLEDFALPDFDDVSMDESTDVSEAAEPAGLDWLENLAAEQGGDFGEMDLSGLGDELANLDLSGLEDEDAVTEASDPMEWLNEMSGEDQPTFDLGEIEAEQPPFAAQQPAADEDVDPIEWLESLAARQENPPDTEEFMTSADLDIPIPDEIEEAEAPGYEDYAFEDTDAMASVPMPDFDDIDALDQVSHDDPDDPVAWLDSLASQQGNQAQDDSAPAPDDEADTDEVEETDADVLEKLNQGISDPNDMENWMSALLEKGASRTDVPDYIEEEEEDEAIQAQIPDWLLEQVGAPPEMEGQSPAVSEEDDEDMADLPDGLDDIDAPIDETEIPDWLQEDVVDTSEMENIFEEQPQAPADETPAASVEAPAAELDVDTDDPWVQAFEEERTQSGVPDWYKERLANAETQENPTVELAEASFDEETRLPAGQLEAVPDWLGGSGEAPPTPEPAEEAELVPADTSWLQGMIEEDDQIDDDDMPDWLRESASGEENVEPAVAAVTEGTSWLESADIETNENIPDWLLETVDDDSQQVVVTPDAEPQAPPQPEKAEMVPAATSPAPPVPVDIDVEQTLQSARQKIEANEVESGLHDYEAIVRVNAQLDVVVNDLSTLVNKPQFKQSATAHRVLGDGLMRQGKLQDALDTYRKALNLL